jgi:two-component system chemotaxis sensor kinase CheA
VPGYVGATFLDDGSIALIADGRHIVRRSLSVASPVLDAAPPGPARAAEASPKVLVVDDQFTVRELQRTILTGAGYTVLTARDGREALEQLAHESDVRLVLTDIEMPVMDGFALLLALRDDARWATLPVVIVSSRGSEADRRRGAEAGADAYVDKGEFDQRTLLAIVERLVEHP